MSRSTVAHWGRLVGYWAFTVMIAYEMAAGSLWDDLQIAYVRGVFEHLGYPLYMLYILGAWKLPCAVVLMVPRFPRLKEWAYAGAFFNYSGAAASHVLVHDGPGKWVPPFVAGLLTLASWALRPSDRRLERSPVEKTRPMAWVVPILGVIAMLIVAVLTLPKGPNPY